MVGSSAMAGRLDVERLMGLVDRQGLSAAEAFHAAGIDPGRIGEARRQPKEFYAYIELHIEQGAVLESAGAPIGAVTGIAGPLFLAVRLTGRTDHAGATPMSLRRDALVAAAEVVLAAQQLAVTTSPTAVATVGRLEVKPGAVNAIPGQVDFTLDVRDIYEENRDHIEAVLRAEIERTAGQGGLEYTIRETARHKPVLLPADMVELVAEACSAVAAPGQIRRLPSGAGHDAQVMAGITRAGMIFIRSKDGVSHSPHEYSSPADIAFGAQALYRSVLALDEDSAGRMGYQA
jgi:allantoate deiminase